jgi:GntR family transcriptional regulator, transcriptional repressor for pyruvate dehydrogenase complex
MSDEGAKPTNERRSEQALRHIMALILEGQLSPGSRLPSERQLAETVGVSRPILREALNTLEARGYIDRRSKSGNYLCTAIPHSVRERIDLDLEAKLLPFQDVIELRKGLETWAVQKAATQARAEGADRAFLGDLELCLRTMERIAAKAPEARRDEDFQRYQEADLEFHKVIARMTKNVVYIHLFDYLVNLVRRSITVTREIVQEHFFDENNARHRTIYEAIETGDVGKAVLAMGSHFELVEQNLARVAS